MPTQQAVYVALHGEWAFAASAHLGDVQAAAVARESKYDREPREYRWDEVVQGDRWQLMRRNLRTGRWNKAYVQVQIVPVVDVPSPAAPTCRFCGAAEGEPSDFCADGCTLPTTA